MKPWKAVAAILIVTALLCLVYGGFLIRHGFSARERPSGVEEVVARSVRSMATPSGAKREKNPFSPTPEILQEARRHFADHCATCHANDGGGQTEIGQNLYPKAPDIRSPRTQNLTDGEIFYIIHNGVRLTGMPAWGNAHKDDESWKLVLFIRHLPKLTSEEKKDMEQFNPQSPMERSEEQEERDFLKGENQSRKTKKHHH